MTAMSDGLSKLLLNYIVKDLNAASCFRFFDQQKTYLEKEKENSKHFFSYSHSSNLLNFNCSVLITAKWLKENISRICSFQLKISTMHNSI